MNFDDFSPESILTAEAVRTIAILLVSSTFMDKSLLKKYIRKFNRFISDFEEPLDYNNYKMRKERLRIKVLDIVRKHFAVMSEGIKKKISIWEYLNYMNISTDYMKSSTKNYFKLLSFRGNFALVQSNYSDYSDYSIQINNKRRDFYLYTNHACLYYREKLSKVRSNLVSSLRFVTTVYMSDNDLCDFETTHMVNLKKIVLSSNDITELDLSKNILLEHLDVSKNRLKHLNLSKNTKLLYLDVDSNCLDYVNCIACRELQYIDLSRNPDISCSVLKRLDRFKSLKNFKMIQGLSFRDKKHIGMEKLKHINVCILQYASVDVIRMKNLTELELHDVTINDLILTNSKNLKYLELVSVDLDTLDLSKNTKLKNLDFHHVNGVKFLDLRNNNKLTSIKIQGGQLKYLYVADKPNLTYLDVRSRKIKKLRVENCPNVKNLYIDIDVSYYKFVNMDLSKLHPTFYRNARYVSIGSLRRFNLRHRSSYYDNRFVNYNISSYLLICDCRKMSYGTISFHNSLFKCIKIGRTIEGSFIENLQSEYPNKKFKYAHRPLAPFISTDLYGYSNAGYRKQKLITSY